MMWSVAGKRTRYVEGGEVSFSDLYGKPITFPLEGTRYKVTFGSSPVYFVRSGAPAASSPKLQMQNR